jgi:hypothetical protein
MKMKRRLSGTQVLGLVLFLIACSFGIASQQNTRDSQWTARAQWNDAAPLGGKGFRLLLARLGYRVRLQTAPLRSMPADAKVWLLLDPVTHFSRSEAQLLWKWVERGGTLIFADTPDSLRSQVDTTAYDTPSTEWLRNKMALGNNRGSASERRRSGQLLPDLQPLPPEAAAVYWSGVKTALGSTGMLDTQKAALEIAGTPFSAQLVRFDVGRGRVFVLPDALLFSNYALPQADNAVFTTNLLRVHVPAPGTVYFDERQHRGNDAQESRRLPPNLLYYLWQPPLRWALLQLLVAGLLLWALYGRRLGSPVPLPDRDPVTRASQFALAMSSLFQKASRPRAAALTVGEEFRRTLARRVGLSPQDTDAAIVERVALATGLPAAHIDRLLLRARVPGEQEVAMLSDAQEMEAVLRRLDTTRH